MAKFRAFLHGGVSFEPYKDQFASLIPSKKMNYFETYNASEGFLDCKRHRENRTCS